MLKLDNNRKTLYQWDVGVVGTLTIDGVDEVHFSNLRYGVSFNIKVVDNKVEIPPEVLQSGADIFCWAFVREQNGGYTKKEQTFNVEKRPRPADYVYEPTEILSWETLKKEIEKLDEDTTKSLADLEKGTIKELDAVNLITCESGVYLTNKITYKKPFLPQPFTEMIPNKALLIVVKNEVGIQFQWIGSAYILAGLSNADGEFENEFTKYTFEDYATKEYVDKLIENIESGGSDYILPIGGDELGGVKNGGNVVINEDGTMTAPEFEVTDEQVNTAVNEYLTKHPVDGSMSADAKSLLITILRNGVYSTDQNNNITALAAELGVIEDEPDTPDEPTTTDNITVVDGVMTIFSVGSEITVSDGVMSFA